MQISWVAAILLREKVGQRVVIAEYDDPVHTFERMGTGAPGSV